MTLRTDPAALAFSRPLHAGELQIDGPTTAVVVRDLIVEADIGVNAEEIGRQQPLRISVEILIEGPAEDRIEDTFDYDRIAAVANLLASTRINLIETFARRLAEACLTDSRVLAVEVSVEKPKALTNALASARVQLRLPALTENP